MMRMIEIALFLIILNATIGFVADIPLFPEQYITTPQNDYMSYNISSLSESIGDVSEDPGFIDYAKFSITWAWEGFKMLLKIIFSIVVIYPAMVEVFHVPPALAALLNVGVIVIYILGIIQWKSGKSFKNYA